MHIERVWDDCKGALTLGNVGFHNPEGNITQNKEWVYEQTAKYKEIGTEGYVRLEL